MAFLHRLRDGARALTVRVSRGRPGHGWTRRILRALAATVLVTGCGNQESDLPPDQRLQSRLGLEPGDRVHEVVLSGGEGGAVEPSEIRLLTGDYLQFVTADSWVHEIRFDRDSLASDALAFMEELDQMDSPPLVSRGSRFVLSFVGAPEGRYPYRVEGNLSPRRGVVVVAVPDGR
ncbi:MAG: hypothetical protein U5R14_13440 [Gemmatimonadota bacterium]|nr:hypothetical protein [Gemmatimonadota bacterium]